MARPARPVVAGVPCRGVAEAKLRGEPLDGFAMRYIAANTVRLACNFIMRVVVPSTFRFHTEIGSGRDLRDPRAVGCRLSA